MCLKNVDWCKQGQWLIKQISPKQLIIIQIIEEQNIIDENVLQ